MDSFTVLALVTLSLAGRAAATASWCVCSSSDPKTLQTTLDYACGHGADCNPIHVNQACYSPNTIGAHCNYAVNSYFQKNSQQSTACDFSGTARVVATDPSTQGCSYPSSASSGSSTPTTPTGSGSGSGTGTGSSSGMGTPSTMPNGSPLVTSPSGGSGVLGGGSPPGTLGPAGLDTDMSRGGVRLPTRVFLGSSVVVALTALIFS